MLEGGANGEDLDGGGDCVGDDAGAGLVGAEPYRGDASPGVEREIGGHLLPPGLSSRPPLSSSVAVSVSSRATIW